MRAYRKFRHAACQAAASSSCVWLFAGLPAAAFADTAWFGGNGDWGAGGNWSAGQPGIGDVASIAAGTATLNFDTTILGLSQSGGAISGTGILTLTGSSTFSGGTLAGTGTTTFNGLTIAGPALKIILGGRTVNFNGVTDWSGNTANNNNTIRYWNGGTINNNGTFNDANPFDSFVEHNVGGPHSFNNLGTFNKKSDTVTSIDFGVAFNNSGTVNVDAGVFLPGGGGTSSGTFNIASGAKLELRNGSHTLNNVTIGGQGTFQISTDNVGADAVVTLNGGTLAAPFLLSGSILAGSDHTFQGAATWTGGSITGAAATTFGSDLTIAGANSKTISGGRTVNAGNTTWSGNTAANNNAILMGGASIFNSTATFTDSNTFDSSIGVGNGGATFNNKGSFVKQSNTTTSISVLFNNTGTVNVNAGTLLPGGGGTSSGSFNIASGAKLELRNGSHTLNNVTIGGQGTFQISTDNVGADAVVTLNGGTLTAPLLLSGSILTGSDHTFQGAATWTGGSITGAAATTFGSDLTIAGANSKTISGGRTVNAGNTTWSGNTAANNNAILMGGASIFNSTGTFTDSNSFDSSVGVGNGGAAFNNKGSFVKQSNTTTSIGVLFNNSGSVDIDAGTLLPGGGGTSSGSFNIADGARLEFRNGRHTLDNATTRGAGMLQISTDNVGGDAVVTVNGGLHTSAVLISGSALTGTAHTFQGPATWTGGTITGASSTTFAGTLAITGANSKTISGRTVNAGNTTWSGNTAANNNAILMGGASIFRNTGTFTEANTFGSNITAGVGGGSFVNEGTFDKQSATTTVLGVVLNNTGTVDLAAGTLQVTTGFTNQGLVKVAAGATFLGSNATFVNGSAGTLAGNGTVATLVSGDIVNQGNISPGNSIGHLTLDGDLTQTASGSLNFELGNPSSFDTLTVTDDVTLHGTVVAWNAGYAPVLGDTFVVLTFDQRLGSSTFDAVATHGYGPGVQFEAIYGTHDVSLRVTAVPEPQTWAMLLAGLSLVGVAAVLRPRKV